MVVVDEDVRTSGVELRQLGDALPLETWHLTYLTFHHLEPKEISTITRWMGVYKKFNVPRMSKNPTL